MKRETKDLLVEIKDHFRERLNKYTRAFKMLPEIENPHILDIGCGSGVPTIELAKLSDGEIIGIDINQSLLDKLNKKIEEEGFSGRVKTVKCSLLAMDFPNESFDIIWAEGSIWIIGFEKGLKEWRRLLKRARALLEVTIVRRGKKTIEVTIGGNLKKILKDKAFILGLEPTKEGDDFEQALFCCQFRCFRRKNSVTKKC